MSLITDNNPLLPDRKIPEAPPLVVDPTAQKVQKHVVVMMPEVVANEIRAAQRLNEEAHKQIQKLLIDRILEKPLFLLLTQETAPRTTPKDAPAINDFIMNLLLPNFDAILSRIGHAKMDRILYNLLKIGKGETIEALSRKLGLEELEKEWDKLLAGTDKEAFLQLVIHTEDALARYPSLLLLLPDNLQLLIKSVRQMKKVASDNLDIWIKGIHDTYNPCTLVQNIAGLSNDALQEHACRAVVKKYPFMDLSANKETVIHAILTAYMPTPLQCKEKRLVFAGSLETLSASLKDKIDDTISDLFVENFAPKYVWLKTNILHMQVIYNQESDIHRNMGVGTCLQNCCEREALLLKNPEMNAKDIPMPSSQKGRRIRAAMNVASAFSVPQDAPTPFDSFAEFGLSEKRTISLNNLSNLSQLLDQHPEPIMLSFETEATGHVINIQCDPKTQTFRFFDDNLGIFSYGSKEELVEELTDCLKAFYHGFGNYTLWLADLV